MSRLSAILLFALATVTAAFGALAQQVGNYAFISARNGSSTDMSALTTQLVGPDQDDTASSVTNIGFEFVFQGVVYQQFSANSNGLLQLGPVQIQGGAPIPSGGQAGLALIAPYNSDLRTHTTGKVHYRVIGTPPSRQLVVEWLNMQSVFNVNGTPDLTFQVRLHETTGVIEFVYKSMSMSALAANSVQSIHNFIGFSSNNTAGTIAEVLAAQSGTPPPSETTSSSAPQFNFYTTPGPIAALTGSTNGSLRTFKFTPPVPQTPTGLSFPGPTTATSMLLHWTSDLSQKLGYAIYRSGDGTNFVFDGTAPANANTYNATNLVPSTNYTWRVYAFSEGALSSTALPGSNATTAGTARSSAASGNWSVPATWVGNTVPGASDEVTIAPGHTVTIDTSPSVASLTIMGTLQFELTTARTLTTTGSLTVMNGGSLETQLAGTQRNHVVAVGGNLTNNGDVFLDGGLASGGGAAQLVFNGPFNSTITLNDLMGAGRLLLRGAGTGGLLLAKTGGVGPTLTLSTTNFSMELLVGGNTSPTSGGFLTINGGTFRLTGTDTLSTPLFAATAWTIPAGGGLTLDNPNATITAQAQSATVAGQLIVSQGTLNVGNLDKHDSLILAPGANVNFFGGAVNVGGRLGVVSDADAITYRQTGGTITVCTIGNNSTTAASFDMGASSVSDILVTGGTVVFQLANSALTGPGDYWVQAELATFSGGTIQFGNASSGSAQSYVASGYMGDLVISGGGGSHKVTLVQGPVFETFVLNVSIASGTTLDLGGNVVHILGSTFLNNGTLIPGNSGTLRFHGITTNTYKGSGTAQPLFSLDVSGTGGLTIDPASSGLTTSNLNLPIGSLTNAGKVTLGVGANAGPPYTVSIGGGNTTPSVDHALTFNLGTVGQSVTYGRTAAPLTTGPEINPSSRTLVTLQFDDGGLGHALTLGGGSIAVQSSLGLTSGRIVVPANQAINLGAGASVTRTSGWVDGTLNKTFAAAGSKNFEVGSANGYSPVTVNLTSAPSFPTGFAVTALQQPFAIFGAPAFALQRQWYLLGAQGTVADLTFNWLDPTDLPPSAPESAMVLYNQNGTVTAPGGTVNAATNSATISGVSSFAAWSLGVPVGLSIAKAAVGASFTKGQAGAQYTLTVSNGATPVPDGTVITVTDTLPAPLTFVSATGSGWTCGAVGQLVTCTVTQTAGQPFAANAASAITLTVNVAANAPASVLNTVLCNCNLVNPSLDTANYSVGVNPIAGSGIALAVAKSGSGSGFVGDAGNTINCGTFCTNNYPAGTSITLNAAPAAGSVFTGWLGACIGTGNCTVTLNAATSVSATFANASIGSKILDVDGNGQYDALSDGLLILRRLFQLSGPALVANALGTGAQRTDPAAIAAYLDDVKPLLDIDGNGTTDALTDGLLILRYFFQLTGNGLINNAVGANATRTTPAAIQAYLDTLKP